MNIRKITQSDLPSVVEMLHEFAAFENLSKYCTVTEERLHKAMFAEDSVVEGLIAFDGEAPVAYSLFYPNFSSFRGQRGIHLDDIYIKAEYRKNGLGQVMLKEIARIAASRGFERIDFNVLEWNTPALKFYEKLGAVCNMEERHFKFADKAFAALATT
ncbi:MAG: N-acetyltransferase family protein [Pyrinomonadaceae bacterium]